MFVCYSIISRFEIRLKENNLTMQTQKEVGTMGFHYTCYSVIASLQFYSLSGNLIQIQSNLHHSRQYQPTKENNQVGLVFFSGTDI